MVSTISRRRFLERVGGVVATAGAGTPFEPPVGTSRGSALPEADSLRSGDWPMYRGDRCLTGRARLPGELSEPPTVAWQYKIEAGKVWQVIDPAPGRHSKSATLVTEGLAENYLASRAAKKWGMGPRLVDLYGDGRLVPDPGGAAKLLPDVPGLQTVEFSAHIATDKLGKGQVVHPSSQGVCYAYNGGRKREAWRSEEYDTIENYNFCVADVDNDGKLEVILAPHYRVIVFDGQTGRTKHLLKIHPFRNYGFFCCHDLTGSGLQDFVIIANFAMHVDVVKNQGDHLRLLWRRDLETDIQSKHRIVQPGPNPVLDVNGDGEIEIVFNLFNEKGDGQWHLKAYDALSGETVFDLPQTYLNGTADVNGDGVPELFVTHPTQLYIPDSAPLSLLRVKGCEVTPIWRHSMGRWAVCPSTLPLTRSAMPGSGIDLRNVVTAEVKREGARGFFVLESAEGRAERCIAYVLEADDRVAENWRTDLPARSHPQVHACADVDADGIDEVLISFNQESCETVNRTSSIGATVSVVGLDRIGVSSGEGQSSMMPTALSPVVNLGRSRSALIVFEGANDDLVALEPPTHRGEHPTIRWRVPGAGPAVLADVNGDGLPEAIFGHRASNGEGEIVAVEIRSGRDLWRHRVHGFPGPHPESNSGGIMSWWVGHYTSTHRDDVWVSARRSTMHSDECWAIHGGDGSELWHLSEVRTDRTAQNARGWGAGGSFVCSADVDGDGLEDLISLYPVNYMAAKGTNGSLIYSVEAAEGLFPGIWGAYGKPIVADFNGDGRDELLWCGGYHYGLTTLDAKVIWYHPGGASMAGLGDVDGDGNLELGFTGCEGGRGLRCLDAATGSLKWEWPLKSNPHETVYTADVDGDGLDEFLFAHEKDLYAVNGKAGVPNLVWQAGLPSVPGCLTLADVDRDGKIEILFIGKDSTLYCLDQCA
jgi:hypothetical protein